MRKCRVCKTNEISEHYDICLDCFEKLPRVRVSSPVGPCLTNRRLVRVNRTTCTVAFRNGEYASTERETKGLVHGEPCSCCTDHEHTQYPMGYTN
jgi:hypothetical protein